MLLILLMDISRISVVLVKLKASYTRDCCGEGRWFRVKHFGDITKLNGAELPVVDVITGGSPC